MIRELPRLLSSAFQTAKRRVLNLLRMPARVFQIEKGVVGFGQKLDALGDQHSQLVTKVDHLVGQFDELLKSTRGEVFLTTELPEVHRRRIIEELIAEHADAADAYKLIVAAIEQISDAQEREHARLHEVRYLSTYLMVPRGPGRLIDIAASDIYALPLTRLKSWTIEPIKVLEFDYECDRFPFADSSVDGVLFCEVIEHFVLDPMFCLIEINRVLRPGGFIILTTPNTASWFSIYQALRQHHPSRWPVYAGDAPNRKNHIHAREYVVSEIVQLLEAAGFGDIAITTRETGVTAPYRPIPGFDATNRGETIFCSAYKRSQPVKRFVAPIYLEDRKFGPPST